MQRIAIIGAGKGGLSLLQAIKDNSRVEIVGICDKKPFSAGLAEAARAGIRTFDDYNKMFCECSPINVIINVTNDPSLGAELEKVKDPETEIVYGKASMFIWVLINAQQQMHQQAEERIVELKELYELGLRLSSGTDLREVYTTIIDYATMLTNTPAGSIAILDETTGDMTLAAAKGFSEEFFALRRWKLRKGGLTSYILNQEKPVILDDVASLREPVNPALVREGVKSIIAAPLTVRGKIIGILYVDDFKLRKFGANDASILGLMTGYAALAIERMKLLEDTRRMAITDGLTGLHNQQEYMMRLEEEVARASRYGRTLSVVELDIDHFKTYNDRFGHMAGNELLKALSLALGDYCRMTDMCARTGGEEFAVIMPETDFEKAVNMAERLRALVEGMRFSVKDDEDQAITISVGVASCSEHGTTASELYHSVDQALYKAKEAGRNRVIGFPDRLVATMLV